MRYVCYRYRYYQYRYSMDMVDILKDIIKENQTTIIVGDFNLCMIDEKTNGVTRFLEGAGFSQHTMDATHLLGGHIDHVYSNHNPALYSIDVILYSSYYTCLDHDAILVTIKKVYDSEVYIHENIDKHLML